MIDKSILTILGVASASQSPVAAEVLTELVESQLTIHPKTVKAAINLVLRDAIYVENGNLLVKSDALDENEYEAMLKSSHVELDENSGDFVVNRDLVRALRSSGIWIFDENEGPTDQDKMYCSLVSRCSPQLPSELEQYSASSFF